MFDKVGHYVQYFGALGLLMAFIAYGRKFLQPIS
jgi:hypothetical protein